jgi:hypothetical protein
MLFCIFAALYGVFLVVFFGNEGLFGAIRVYVIYPLLFLIIISAINSEEQIVIIYRWLMVAFVCSVLYQVWFLLYMFKLVPWFFQSGVARGDRLGFFTSQSQYNYFIIPVLFLKSIETFFEPKKYTVSEKIFYFVIFLITFCVGNYMGLRAFYLCIFFTFFMAIVIYYFRIVDEIRKINIVKVVIFLFIIMLILFTLFNYNVFSSLSDRLSLILSHKTLSQSGTSGDRLVQFNALIDYFIQNPFGSGLSADVPGFVRSAEDAGSYELSYIALLMQLGIIMIIPFIVLFTFVFFNFLKLVRKKFLYHITQPFFVGFISFFIASFFDPYFFKYDSMWTFYFPLIMINYYRKCTQEKC